MAPDYQTPLSLGYLEDKTHFTRQAAMVYSAMVMDTLVPEPHAMGVLALGAFLLRRRGRQTAAR